MGVYINREMRDPETGRFLNGHNRYEQLKTVEGAEWKPLSPVADDEMWKDIGGFEGRYRISNYGRVRNREGLVKPQRKRNGYYSVGLRDGKGRKHFSLHRLVADAFVKNKNPEAFKQINHRDENKENNRADNLEWCDGMYNTHYGTAIERMRKRRWGSVKYVPVVVDTKPKPITNADKIRASSDEELAAFIVRCVEADFFRANVLGTHSNSAEEWLDWLKEEVNDDNNS